MNKKVAPPKILLRFFKWFCRPKLHQYIEGDLLELYQERVEKVGKRKADLRFALDVLLLFRPGIIGGIFSKESIIRYGIIRNYFVTTFRSAKREKAFAILNVLCLAIGFTACLYIGLYMVEEVRYDTFHEKANRIYRINQTYIWNDTDKLFGSTGPGVMPAVKNEVPEFESMTRVHDFENTLISNISENSVKVFEEEKIFGADSNFLDVFTFPLLRGNPQTALTSPNSIVLTENMAYKYFGNIDILGKQLLVGESNNEAVYQITGVAADVPNNSHIDFNFLISMSSLKRLKRQPDTWWWTAFVTFGVLNPEADINLVKKKVAAVPEKYLDAFLKEYQGISYEAFIASGKEWNLYVQPLLDIHLHSTHVISRLNEVGDVKSLYILGFITALILLLSIINFINLSTARSAKRAKEVGVRKVLGSYRSGLVGQFLLESLLFCFTALLVSGILVNLFLPIFNTISGKELAFGLILESNFLIIILLVTLVVGILAGFYPAFYLSTFKPSQVLKGGLVQKKGLGLLRNALVTLQFSISIALIVCSLIINEQVQYWLTMDLGFNRENKLILQHVERLGTSLDVFKNKISTYPQVEHITYSSGTPPYVGDYDGSFHLKGNPEVQKEISFWLVDENFVDTYGFNMIAGKNFSKVFDNNNSVLVSRSFTKAYGMKNPDDAINQHLLYDGLDLNITGVFEDFNSELDWVQRPIAFFYKDRFDSPYATRELTIGFKDQLSGTEIKNLLANIEQEWRIVNPNAPFDYSFLNQEYEMVYASTIKFSSLMKLYSVLAILIAGLGLVGLVAYVIEKRKREIGIRKVLGASVSNIIVSLTNEFFRLLAIGFVIASIISWYIMQSWVAGFTYQVSIKIETFILSGLSMALIIVFILCFQTVKAALSNPVDALRSE